MKILFSIYNEDNETGVDTFLCSKLIITLWSMDEIEKHFDVYNGFHEEILWGPELSFWDITCYHDLSSYFIQKINEIPEIIEKNKKIKYPFFMRIEGTESQLEDVLQANKNQAIFSCHVSREECGASGYYVVIQWMAAHPLPMVFIGGIIWDVFKAGIKKIICKVSRREYYPSNSKPVLFSIKRFYKNFERYTNISSDSCQIISLTPRKAGIYSIVVRTQDNELYIVKSYVNGRIYSFELKKNDELIRKH